HHEEGPHRCPASLSCGNADHAREILTATVAHSPIWLTNRPAKRKQFPDRNKYGTLRNPPARQRARGYEMLAGVFGPTRLPPSAGRLAGASLCGPGWSAVALVRLCFRAGCAFLLGAFGARPSGLVGLAAAGDSERVGRHIFGDQGAGADVSAVTDAHRRDERRIAADENSFAD